MVRFFTKKWKNCIYSLGLSLFLEKNNGNLFCPIVRGEAEQGSIKSLKIITTIIIASVFVRKLILGIIFCFFYGCMGVGLNFSVCVAVWTSVVGVKWRQEAAVR